MTYTREECIEALRECYLAFPSSPNAAKFQAAADLLAAHAPAAEPSEELVRQVSRAIAGSDDGMAIASWATEARAAIRIVIEHYAAGGGEHG